MSELKCPKCGSDNIATERRPDGYHSCLECHYQWRNDVTHRTTNRDKLQSMSNKELAEFQALRESPCPPPYTSSMDCPYDGNLKCVQCWLNWLNAPAER